MLFFPKQGLARTKAFFKVPMTVCTVNCLPLTAVVLEISPHLRKDDSLLYAFGYTVQCIYLS